MDNPTTHSRRRLTRTGYPVGDESTATTASSLQAGPSRLPELTQLVDVDFSDLDRSSDDLESDEQGTPKLYANNKLPAAEHEQTPAARLRALLSRVPTGSSPSTTPVAPNPRRSLNDYDSDNAAADTTHATASQSVAQTSLRSVFSHALRPPGDTPLKQRRRRKSFDSSDVEPTPRTEKPKFKDRRKSFSDEEVENAHRSSSQTPSVRPKSQPLTLDVLRQRFMNHSNSESQDDAPLSKSDLSDDTAELLKELNASRTSPPPATSTPQKSLQMSFASQFQMQSNLMDQDSEMQRAFEGAESYDATGIADTGDTSQHPVNFPSSSESEAPRPLSLAKTSTKALSRAVSSPESTNNPTPRPTTSSLGKTAKDAYTPLKQPRSTSSLSREGSSSRIQPSPARTRVISSPRPSEHSSRSSSISQTDYRDRMHDLDDDLSYKREREWNQPLGALSRRTSTRSLVSPKQGERSRTSSLKSTTPSSAGSTRPYQLSPSVAQALKRHSLSFDRQDSPTSSAYGSQEEDPIVAEVVQERERNWNSPRPIWRARARVDSISSVGSVSEDEGDESHGPQFRSKMTSPRSLAEIRAHVARSRTTSLQGSPSSARQSPNAGQQSPQSLGRLADQALASIVSPSRKRHSLHLASSSGEIAVDISSSPLAKAKNRLSYPTPSKPISTLVPGDKSTIRAPRKSQIPIASPSKRNVPATTSQTSTVALPTSDITPSASEDEGLAPPPPIHGLNRSTGALNRSTNSLNRSTNGSEENQLTPRQRPISPPPLDSPVQQPSPLSRSTNSVTHEEQLIEFNPNVSESEIDAPFNSTPIDPDNYELPSFTATPPLNATPLPQPTDDVGSESVEVPQLPELPELPDLPSTDESESETNWQTPSNSRHFPAPANTTAFKTPKPPGAWADTPAPRRRSRSYSDSISIPNPRESQVPASSAGPNWSAIQTPRPPGGWFATPAPARKPQYVDQSIETDTEPESDAHEPNSGGGVGSERREDTIRDVLATPAPSISKGRQYLLQTPAAPGAWIATPAARKNVHFDNNASTTDDSITHSSPDQPKNEPPVALQTPPDSPELTPASPRRKTPSIRVLDAFGNETREEDQVDFSSVKTPRRQPIRYVDALGNVTEDGPSDISKDVEPVAGTRGETLARMRKGLDDLVQEIHELDSSSAPVKSEVARIKELDAVSINSREKRVKLTQQIRAANEDLRGKVHALGDRVPATTAAAPSYFRTFVFIFFVCAQIIVAIVFYRLYCSFTRDSFLTTYYDPYNPFIHLYTSRSRILEANLSEATPWTSVFDLLRRRELGLFSDKAMENLYIHLVKWQAYVWEKWGDNMAGQGNGWPPT